MSTRWNRARDLPILPQLNAVPIFGWRICINRETNFYASISFSASQLRRRVHCVHNSPPPSSRVEKGGNPIFSYRQQMIPFDRNHAFPIQKRACSKNVWKLNSPKKSRKIGPLPLASKTAAHLSFFVIFNRDFFVVFGLLFCCVNPAILFR